MRKTHLLIGLSVLTALAITFTARTMPIEDRLAEIHVKKALPEFADSLATESPEIQWLMLEYADDRLLLLKAQAALLKYPEIAREVLPLYGYEPEFRKILTEYGEQVLLPVHHFLNNEIWSVSALHYTSTKYSQAKEAAGRTFRRQSEAAANDSEEPAMEGEAVKEDSGLTDIQRGWYAVNFIEAEGYDFLGQFVVDASGQSRWVQSERFVEGVTAIFTGGVRDLEAKWRADEERTLAGYGWAGLDLVFIGAGLKLARAGKSVATAGKVTTRASRGLSVTARFSRIGGTLMKHARWAKWPAGIGVGVLAITNPGLINDALALLADVFGLPAWLVQLVGWSLILFPVLAVVSVLFKYLVRPVILVFSGLVNVLMRFAPRSPAAVSA